MHICKEPPKEDIPFPTGTDTGNKDGEDDTLWAQPPVPAGAQAGNNRYDELENWLQDP